MFKKGILPGLLGIGLLMVASLQGQSDEQMEVVRKIRENREPTFGTWVYLKDPAITEMLADAGLDWMIIDMEHGNLNEDLVQSLVVPLKGTKCVPLVRIPELDRGIINKLLDTGVQGILVPFVYSKEDAQKAVRYAKYPPQGDRGIGYARAQGWGQKVQSYLGKANDAVLIGLIIETKEALDQIDEILEVPGIDFILPGTYDLSGALGVIGQFDHPLVLKAKEKIEKACKRKNIALASWAMGKEGIEKAIKEGSNFVALAGDVDWIGQGVGNLLKAAQEVTSH
ncbi:aldolase/citrate lyase family protein [Acidobacteria bacterium AH-259-G07]|nr:aldolase/citrate lyase family protein [Acidobacteria bacterium AH-259-G07]